MRTLAIECATPACSVALFDGDALVGHRHEILGRGHAERLVPFIADLPDRGHAGRILVSLGPGSFTGARIGIAAARALALAWGCEVLGFHTLDLVATMAQDRVGPVPVSVVMTGGHGEWFVRNYDASLSAPGEHRSLPPKQAAAFVANETLAGSTAEQCVELRGNGEALPMLPDARFALALPTAALRTDIRAIYGRPPDARPVASPPNR